MANRLKELKPVEERSGPGASSMLLVLSIFEYDMIHFKLRENFPIFESLLTTDKFFRENGVMKDKVPNAICSTPLKMRPI